MGRYDYYGFPAYESVGKKKAKAEKALKKLQKKNAAIKPVIIEGTKIAKTWWGTAWIKNLEGYADYSNRLGRGRSYARHGSVLDLQITEGVIKALVLGSRSEPYKVIIEIKPLSPVVWKKIIKESSARLTSLKGLLEGKFPKDLMEIFTSQKQGLFPSPGEISFECSCPDWASMCKHVAAVLYGVGARLDEDPSLFFILRKVNIDDLISEAVTKQSKNLLAKKSSGASSQSRRIMNESDVTDVFGLEMAEKNTDGKNKNIKKTVVKKTASKKKASGKKKTAKKAVKKAVKKTAKKNSGKTVKKAGKKTANKTTKKKNSKQ